MKRIHFIGALALLSVFTFLFAGCEGQPPTAGTPAAGKAADPNATAKAMMDNPSIPQEQKDAIKRGMEKRSEGAPAAGSTGN